MLKQRPAAATGPRPSIPAGKLKFVPVARSGIAHSGNAYVHCMQWYRNRLYVGLTRYVYLGLRPYDLSPDLEVFPVKVPEATRRLELCSQTGAEIWRYDPEECTWVNVHRSPVSMGSRGFEVARHIGFRSMAVFQGLSDPEPALYTISWGSHMGAGPFVLRCADGEHFEECAPDERRLFGSQTLRSLVAFKGRLFTIPTARDSGERGYHEQCVVLVSKDPRYGGWEVASPAYFGDKRNVSVFELGVFNDHLYAGVMNPYEGFQLWKTDGEGDPPFLWSPVISKGAYRGKLNEGACSLQSFNGCLYVGTGIWAGGYDRIHNVGPAAPELIRVYPDDSWDLLVGEPRQTPGGLKVPKTGSLPGFGNLFCGYFWRMCEHDGWLYVGTFDWSPWLPFTRRERWSEVWRWYFDREQLAAFLARFGGCELWRTRDGERWIPVTRNGFNNPFNCGIRTMVSTPEGIFVGTVNQFGPEVAVQRSAGWKYEFNRRAGVEVWLGTQTPPTGEIRVVPIATSKGDLPESRARAEGPFEKNPVLEEVYGGSGWRHVGFWCAFTKNAKDACENLMEELLAFTRPTARICTPRAPTREELERWLERTGGKAPEVAEEVLRRKRARVLDIGCGLGASTRYLATYFEPEGLTGLSNEVSELSRCRRNCPEATFALSPLPRLDVAGARFDLVVCVEGPSRHGKLEVLFEEVARVLEPGGQLIASEAYFGDATSAGVPDEKEYRKLLEDSGFERIQLLDVTRSCGAGLRERFLTHLWEKFLRLDTAPEAIEEAKKLMPGGGAPLARYWLITAYKPQ